jgi:putative phage-type endonuclease
MSEQGTPEWFAERLGKVTASRICDILAKGKGGAESAARANYRAQLVAERLTGNPSDSYTSTSMQWGTDTEPFARMAYEANTGNLVREAGFVPHPTIKDAGASPDGLIDDDGLLEIKCPNTATHIDYFLSGGIPDKYKPQMGWQCLCTGRAWCEFVSFDPRFPEKYQLHVARFEPQKEYLEMLETEVIKFLAEVEEVITQLQRKAA